MSNVIGFFFPLFICLITFILSILLPGTWHVGYILKENSNEKLNYRLNGLLVTLSILSIYACLCYAGYINWDWIYQIRWYALSGAFSIGVILSIITVFKGEPSTNSVWKDFFLGRTLNIQFWNGLIDMKMWLYLVGAILLLLNILSFVTFHYIEMNQEVSTGVYLSASMLAFFVIDYLFFEKVHLYTYDLFAEKIGFKLVWGCIAFYPYFYVIALWSTVSTTSNTPVYILIIAGVIFLSGWSLSRGANLQKFFFKKNPYRTFLGIQPEFITNGKQKLLVNGYWKQSRHINYLGEIMMGIGIALSLIYHNTWVPWLYPIYYVVLLFPRQWDDDKRCASKYGALWEEYLKIVPYKIIPYIY